MDRPTEYFKNNMSLHLVPGVDIHSYFTFPSGHATIAFATCTIFATLSKSQLSKLGFFFLALFAGYTRVYLSQHFLNDVFAGASIGTVTATFLLVWMEKFKQGTGRKWLERSLLRK